MTAEIVSSTIALAILLAGLWRKSRTTPTIMSRHFIAIIQPKGWQFDAPDSTPLLAAARQAGIDLPASCRNGTCRTCMCRLAHGCVSYRIEWPGLTREEKEEGWILPCAAYPESDVILDVPGARALKRG